jgi:hypothetical protein
MAFVFFASVCVDSDMFLTCDGETHQQVWKYTDWENGLPVSELVAGDSSPCDGSCQCQPVDWKEKLSKLNFPQLQDLLELLSQYPQARLYHQVYDKYSASSSDCYCTGTHHIALTTRYDEPEHEAQRDFTPLSAVITDCTLEDCQHRTSGILEQHSSA